MIILSTLLTFLLTIGLLVTIHEFGHFWVARRLEVKVLRFSIGFGKPLWSWFDKQGTEYAVAAIPLGGYVQMLNEDGIESIAEEDKDKSFDSKPLLSKIAIVVAGPLFNILFAIVAYWLMFVIGTTMVQPVVGSVDADSIAAQAGLQPQDRILFIDNENVTSWQVVVRQLLKRVGDDSPLIVDVANEQGQQTKQLHLADLKISAGQDNLLELIGLQPWSPAISTTIVAVIDDTPAANAGLQPNDKIVRINGELLSSGEQLIALSHQYAGQSMLLDVERGDERLYLDITPKLIDGKGRIGAQLMAAPWPEDLLLRQHYSIFGAIPQALQETWRITYLSAVMLGKLVTGKVPVESLSGPVGIAVGSNQTFSAGITYYLGFLALISIGLAILNLLPIPMLDGGHLLFYVVEAITGKPVSNGIKVFLMKISLFLLLFLMLFTIYNDFSRYILN